jgi:hypothetical protein
MARVLREEIIPFIDARYKTTSDRGISGISFSALFVNYLLFADPDLFQKYQITSPSLWWDDFSIFEQEANFAITHTVLPRQVYLSVGSMEPMDMILGMNRMAETLRARNYAGLDISSFEQVGADHGTFIEYSRALDFLYPVRDNWVNLGGDSAKKQPARDVVRGFLAGYSRHDVRGMLRYLVGDSSFHAIVDHHLVRDRDSYVALLAKRFTEGQHETVKFDSLRSEFEDLHHILMNVGYTDVILDSKVPSFWRGHLLLELTAQPEGWRIEYALDNLPSRSQITTAVRVLADGRAVSGALVSAYTDWLTEDPATARTDSTGTAHVPYEWHVVNNGYLQVQAHGYAVAVTRLPTRDTVSVNLQKSVEFDTATVDRYVGTYSTTDGSESERLTRSGPSLIVQDVPSGYRGALPVVFLTPTRLLVRDGSVITVTLDPTGRSIEFLHRGSRLVRKPDGP